MVTQPNCIHGLNILATAINKIRTSESQLTPIHADLCQLSLKSKCFRVALKYLDVDITTISTSAETRGQNQTVSQNMIFFFKYFSKSTSLCLRPRMLPIMMPNISYCTIIMAA